MTGTQVSYVEERREGVGGGRGLYPHPTSPILSHPSSFDPHPVPAKTRASLVRGTAGERNSWPSLLMETDAHLTRVIYTLNSFLAQVR